MFGPEPLRPFLRLADANEAPCFAVLAHCPRRKDFSVLFSNCVCWLDTQKIGNSAIEGRDPPVAVDKSTVRLEFTAPKSDIFNVLGDARESIVPAPSR